MEDDLIKAKEILMNIDGVVGVGRGNEGIIVMISKKEAIDLIPKKIGNTDITIKKAGSIKAE